MPSMNYQKSLYFYYHTKPHLSYLLYHRMNVGIPVWVLKCSNTDPEKNKPSLIPCYKVICIYSFTFKPLEHDRQDAES